MLLAFLSRRLRTWLVLSLVLPVVGRLLRAVGVRVSGRNPRVGQALVGAGDVARSPRAARSTRRERRAQA